MDQIKPTDRIDRRISVRAMIVHEGKLLCARLNHYDGAIMEETDYWCLPGGGLEEGKTRFFAEF